MAVGSRTGSQGLLCRPRMAASSEFHTDDERIPLSHSVLKVRVLINTRTWNRNDLDAR
jgi:hypothetical protein